MKIFRNLASFNKLNSNPHCVTPLFVYKSKNLNNESKNSTIFKPFNSSEVREILENKNSVIYKINYKLYIIICIKNYV